MSLTKQPKKKISVAISQNNFDKIGKIVTENKDQNVSSVIDYSLDYSLEEIRELFKNPLDMDEELTKRKLEDIKKMKEEKQS